MSHFWLAGDITVDSFLQLTICYCLPLVLKHVFGPGIDQKYLHRTVGHFDIAIDSPSVRAITTPDAGVLVWPSQMLTPAL